MHNFGKLVRQFWQSSSKRVLKFARLSSESVDLLAVPGLNKDELKSQVEPGPILADTIGSRTYSVIRTGLGIGPPPEHVFDNCVRSTMNDSEAWLDSAKVCSMWCFVCMAADDLLCSHAIITLDSLTLREVSFPSATLQQRGV